MLQQSLIYALPLCVALVALPSQSESSADAKTPDQAFERQGPELSPQGSEYVFKMLEFKDAAMIDVARFVAEASSTNVVTTEDAGDKRVTVFLQNVTMRQAIESLCKSRDLWYRLDEPSSTYRLMTTSEYRKDLVVFRESVTKVFTLRHPNAVSIATAIADLYGDRVQLTYGISDNMMMGGGFGGGFGGVFAGGAGGLAGARTERVLQVCARRACSRRER